MQDGSTNLKGSGVHGDAAMISECVSRALQCEVGAPWSPSSVSKSSKSPWCHHLICKVVKPDKKPYVGEYRTQVRTFAQSFPHGFEDTLDWVE